jgi:hypothetical protein
MHGWRTLWIAAVTIFAVVASAMPGWSDAGGGKYSGKLVAVDRSAGTIVVEGMGPWRVKEGVTQLERRTFAVASATEFVSLKRASGTAPSGWTGDFVESALPGWQVQPGDWVIVTLAPDGRPPTAIKIDVWEPSEP